MDSCKFISLHLVIACLIVLNNNNNRIYYSILIYEPARDRFSIKLFDNGFYDIHEMPIISITMEMLHKH